MLEYNSLETLFHDIFSFTTADTLPLLYVFRVQAAKRKRGTKKRKKFGRMELFFCMFTHIFLLCFPLNWKSFFPSFFFAMIYFQKNTFTFFSLSSFETQPALKLFKSIKATWLIEWLRTAFLPTWWDDFYPLDINSQFLPFSLTLSVHQTAICALLNTHFYHFLFWS